MISNCWTDDDLRFLADMKIDGGEAIPNSNYSPGSPAEEPETDTFRAWLDDEEEILENAETRDRQCRLLWVACVALSIAVLLVFPHWMQGK